MERSILGDKKKGRPLGSRERRGKSMRGILFIATKKRKSTVQPMNLNCFQKRVGTQIEDGEEDRKGYLWTGKQGGGGIESVQLRWRPFYG